MFRVIVIAMLATCSLGCSSLGLTLYPAGHFLTKQAEQVLDASPREADLPTELSKDVLPAHFLEPGDELLIEPVNFESNVRVPADQKVLVDGSVDLGEFGRTMIAGLTLEEAESLIEQRIVQAGGEKNEINVRLLEPVHRYYVLGEVNSPGSFPLQGHETVLDAIVAAGGLTGNASPCKLLLSRPTEQRSCRITLPICYREITQLGDSSTNYQLRPGDRVIVATRGFCEEIMFCLATKTCERCCKCQSACPNPALIPFRNAYRRIMGDQPRGDRDGLAPPAAEQLPDSGDAMTEDTAIDLVPIEPGIREAEEVFLETIPAPQGASEADNQPQLDGQLPPTNLAPAIPERFGEPDRQ